MPAPAPVIKAVRPAILDSLIVQSAFAFVALMTSPQRTVSVAIQSLNCLGVLAMVSNPSYDPNPFVKGISYKDYNSLLQDKNLPLINRVTQGLYPPASTVKPYMAMSALLDGVITPQTSFFGAPTWTLRRLAPPRRASPLRRRMRRRPVKKAPAECVVHRIPHAQAKIDHPGERLAPLLDRLQRQAIGI